MIRRFPIFAAMTFAVLGAFGALDLESDLFQIGLSENYVRPGSIYGNRYGAELVI